MKKIIPCLCLAYLAACNSPRKDATPIIKNGDVNISYERNGTGDTSILFVHGWGIDKSYWIDQRDALSKRYTVVTMDLGGHGESGHNRNDWSVAQFAKDVEAVINGLALSHVILVGHSMGGDIILETALAMPDKIAGFIGIDNFKSFTDAYSEEDSKSIDSFMTLLGKHFDSAATYFVKAGLFPPNYADTVAVNRVLRSVISSDSVMATAAILANAQYAPHEAAAMSKLKLPVHLIVSDFGPVDEAKLKLYAREGYTIDTISGVGHYPMIEKSKQFTAVLEKVVAAIGSSK